MDKPQAYVVLGAAGSGRREVLCDLLTEFAGESSSPLVLLSDQEPPSPVDAKLGKVQRWQFTRDHRVVAQVEAGSSPIFFVVDGRLNPVDQLEALRTWLQAEDFELARILCVVHCKLLEQNPGALAWYDACIHFSDVVLLSRREGVPNKWISDFRARYEDDCFPCLFEFVKQGKVKNPALVLDPQARRISQAFDPIEPAPNGGFLGLSPETDYIDSTGEDEEGEEAGEPSPEDEEDEGPEEDPYFLRKLGGQRHKHIPNIQDFLPPVG